MDIMPIPIEKFIIKFKNTKYSYEINKIIRPGRTEISVLVRINVDNMDNVPAYTFLDIQYLYLVCVISELFLSML